MTRIFPVLTITLLLAISSLWLASQLNMPSTTTHVSLQVSPVTLETGQVHLPDGYELVPFLSDEKVQNFTQAETVIEEDVDYGAIMVTSQGTMIIDLAEKAPNTINNFIFLALNHYYEDILFHRVLDGFMAQTGDPEGTGRGGPGYAFDDELDPSLKHNLKGTLSMANAGANTNGSQFFITFTPTNFLDGYDANNQLKNCAAANISCHSVFGQVTEGLEVLDELTRITPGQPAGVVYTHATLADLAARGVTLDGDSAMNVGNYLKEKLGALPAYGASFDIDGYQGIYGRVDNKAAFGFYPIPDSIEAIYIIKKQ